MVIITEDNYQHIREDIKNLRHNMNKRFDNLDKRLREVENNTIRNEKHNEAQNGRINKLEGENEENTVDFLKRQTRRWGPTLTIILFFVAEVLKDYIFS